jgi:hypothetical protein
VLIFVYTLLLPGQQAKPGKLQSSAVWDVREHWIEMYFHIVSLQQVKLLQKHKWALRHACEAGIQVLQCLQ